MKTYMVVITNKEGVEDIILFDDKRQAKNFIKGIRPGGRWIKSIKLRRL